MKQLIFSILIISILFSSCKKSSTDAIKITSTASDIVTPIGLTNYGYISIELNTNQDIPDTIIAIVQLSIPTANNYSELDTCIIPPNNPFFDNTAKKTGIFSNGDLQTQIINVTSKGNYQFTY